MGAIGASILGVYLFDEPVNLFEVICFILVTFGIIGLKLFDTAKQTVDKME
ncbi:sugE protein [Wolbachia pipientis wUni]|nr:sugE protein [Wolbachia pipientis wUni]